MLVAAGDRVRIVDATTIFRDAAWRRRRLSGVGSMRDVLLDRDAELGELGRRLAQARAGSGRVIVVEGPAGIGKSTLLAAAAPDRRARTARSCCARAGSPLEQDAAWGMARQLFEPLRSRPGVGRADGRRGGLARARARARGGRAGARAGDAMHAAVHGLVWLASNLGRARPGRARRRRRPLGRCAVAALAGAAGAARSTSCALGVLCAVRAGEPAGGARAAGRAAGQRARAARAPAAARAGRDRDAGARAAARGERRVRARLPRRHRRQPVPARRAAHPAGRRRRRTGRRGRGAAGARSGPSRSRASSSASSRGCPTAPRSLARAFAVLGPGAPLRHAAALAGLELAERGARRRRAAGRRPARR